MVSTCSNDRAVWPPSPPRLLYSRECIGRSLSRDSSCGQLCVRLLLFVRSVPSPTRADVRLLADSPSSRGKMEWKHAGRRLLTGGTRHARHQRTRMQEERRRRRWVTLPLHTLAGTARPAADNRAAKAQGPGEKPRPQAQKSQKHSHLEPLFGGAAARSGLVVCGGVSGAKGTAVRSARTGRRTHSRGHWRSQWSVAVRLTRVCSCVCVFPQLP
jgi:hypothetical protein